VTSITTSILLAVLPDTALEALALRSVIEASGRSVTLRFIATPPQLFELLDAGHAAPQVLVLHGHGCDGSLHFGPLAPGLGGEILSDGFLPPQAVRGRIALAGTTVLCTACESGSGELGDAFIAGGADVFIAPEGEPDGDDMMLAAHCLMHGLIRGLAANDAANAAMKAVDGRVPLTIRRAPQASEARHAAAL
jgi:hypothetical protein